MHRVVRILGRILGRVVIVALTVLRPLGNGGNGGVQHGESERDLYLPRRPDYRP